CDSNDPFDELACVWDDPQQLQRTVLTLPNVTAGQYALWVEGDDATQGDFTLRVTSCPPVPPPSNDWCGASMLPSVAAGGATTGDRRGAINDDEGDCGFDLGANGEYAADVLFHMALTATQTVTVTVTPDAQTGALFRPVVYVRAPGQCSGAVPPTPLGC